MEWVSLQENIRKGFETGLYSSFSKKVTVVDPEGRGKTFRSMSMADKSLGRGPGYISLALKKNRKITGKDGRCYSIRLGD